MTDRPQAKLVKHTPSGHRLPYWDRYEFECVDCGAIYIRSANTNRINPYCGECSRKHQRERDEANRKRRQLEHDMKVKADAVDELIDVVLNGYAFTTLNRKSLEFILNDARKDLLKGTTNNGEE